MKQSEIDWFTPLWRRVAITAFLAAWTVWEWVWGKDQLFQALVPAALLYALYNFFYKWKTKPKSDETLPPPPPPANPDQG